MSAELKTNGILNEIFSERLGLTTHPKENKEESTFFLSKNTFRVRRSSVGSGCGSVGRAVDSDTRDPRIESSHRQTFVLKNENKEKRGREWPIF